MYVNDVLVYISRTHNDYEEKVYIVLRKLFNVGLYLDVDKYVFVVIIVKYFGFIVYVGKGI